MKTKNTSATAEAPVDSKRTSGDASSQPVKRASHSNGQPAMSTKTKPGTKLRRDVDPLTEEERKEWADCNKGIRRGLRACLREYVEVGRLLHQVREKKLFREDFSSFAAYCLREFQNRQCQVPSANASVRTKYLECCIC
jgi:hypothetical protein